MRRRSRASGSSQRAASSRASAAGPSTPRRRARAGLAGTAHRQSTSGGTRRSSITPAATRREIEPAVLPAAHQRRRRASVGDSRPRGGERGCERLTLATGRDHPARRRAAARAAWLPDRLELVRARLAPDLARRGATGARARDDQREQRLEHVPIIACGRVTAVCRARVGACRCLPRCRRARARRVRPTCAAGSPRRAGRRPRRRTRRGPPRRGR